MSSSKTLRILVVEDNPADADLIRNMLPQTGPAGFQVESVARLATALARLKAAGIDLVLLDLGLPDSQGLQTLRALRQAVPNVPVIVLTGTNDSELGVAAVQDGAQDFLAKGQVNENLLIRSIHHALERQKTAEKLRTSEERLRLVLEASAAGMWDWNLQSDTTFLSPHYGKITGHPTDDVQAYPAFLKQMVYAEDWGSVIGTMNEHLAGRSAQSVVEYRIATKGGSLKWIWGRGQVVERDPAGTPLRMVGTIADITERKQAEESYARLATAVEQAAEAIVITDTNDEIVYTNPAFERTTGYTRAEALGQSPRRLLDGGKHDAELYGRMEAVLQRGEIWHGHLVNRRKDGTPYEEDATISPVRNAAGAVVNYVTLKRDVTHEIQLQGRIRQAQKMEAIGTLAGGIAHDFNNMLGAIFGFSYLLQQDTAENPAAQESINEILKAASRAKDLVQQILTFSRQREQKREIIRLDTSVKEATKFLRASLPAHIKIDLNLAAEAPPVLADPTQIYQVTMNLAANALHAMEDRPGTLTVKLEAFRPDENFLQSHLDLRPIPYARLTVADTGHGMDAKTLEHIFEPFFTTKPAGQGTGLGLAVVHGIIQTHDGAITVESQVGRGSTFQIYFPAQEPDTTAAEATAGDTPRGQGQKILLVDDEMALTLAFKRLLEEQNYQVTCSNCALTAAALVRQSPGRFDLVITDLTMPEMNGVNLAGHIHAIRGDMPVILMSGFAPELTPDKLREAGICDLLQKPVFRTALMEAVHGALTRPTVP